jgi:hypothetical protein
MAHWHSRNTNLGFRRATKHVPHFLLQASRKRYRHGSPPVPTAASLQTPRLCHPASRHLVYPSFYMTRVKLTTVLRQLCGAESSFADPEDGSQSFTPSHGRHFLERMGGQRCLLRTGPRKPEAGSPTLKIRIPGIEHCFVPGGRTGVLQWALGLPRVATPVTDQYPLSATLGPLQRPAVPGWLSATAATPNQKTGWWSDQTTLTYSSSQWRDWR